MTPEIGKRYNWKGQPERLVYQGKKGSWHQFALVNAPDKIWCEILSVDLRLIEEIPVDSQRNRFELVFPTPDNVEWREEFEAYCRKGKNIISTHNDKWVVWQRATAQQETKVADLERRLIRSHTLACTPENCNLDGGHEHLLAWPESERNIQITAEAVRALRDTTGYGLVACKLSLVKAKGNVEEAKSILIKGTW